MFFVKRFTALPQPLIQRLGLLLTYLLCHPTGPAQPACPSQSPTHTHPNITRSFQVLPRPWPTCPVAPETGSAGSPSCLHEVSSQQELREVSSWYTGLLTSLSRLRGSDELFGCTHQQGWGRFKAHKKSSPSVKLTKPLQVVFLASIYCHPILTALDHKAHSSKKVKKNPALRLSRSMARPTFFSVL